MMTQTQMHPFQCFQSILVMLIITITATNTVSTVRSSAVLNRLQNHDQYPEDVPLTNISLNTMDGMQQRMKMFMGTLMADIMALSKVNENTTSIDGVHGIVPMRRNLASYHSDNIQTVENEIQQLMNELYFLYDEELEEEINQPSNRQSKKKTKKPIAFIEKVLTHEKCRERFQEIINKGNKACQLFSDTMPTCGNKKNPKKYTIEPLFPPCNLGHSANNPVPIKITKNLQTKKIFGEYFIKKQEFGPANDFLAMKVSKWLTGIFATKTNAPIFRVFDVVPQFRPRSPCDPKWTKAKVRDMYFFTVAENGLKGDWIESATFNIKKLGFKDSSTEYPYFNALHCTCAKVKRKLLKSLRGAFIIQMLLGAKDRHKGNVLIKKDCTVMNIDYGHFLGTATNGDGLLPWDTHHVSMYNTYLDAYLKKIEMKEKFKKDLWKDITYLRKHFEYDQQHNILKQCRDKSSEYPFVDKLVRARIVRDDFAKKSFPGEVWKADAWTPMAITKTIKKRPFDKYMSYALFGEGNLESKIPMNKEKFFEQMEQTDAKTLETKITGHTYNNKHKKTGVTENWSKKGEDFYNAKIIDVKSNLKNKITKLKNKMENTNEDKKKQYKKRLEKWTKSEGQFAAGKAIKTCR
eukprot:532047_1